jgi:hypothetical protein
VGAVVTIVDVEEEDWMYIELGIMRLLKITMWKRGCKFILVGSKNIRLEVRVTMAWNGTS